MKLAILTAAFNEEKILPDLMQSINAEYDVFLVDDGSDDNTAINAKLLGASVFRHCVNLGQGFAFITGIKGIISKFADKYEYIVFMDADGQHNPDEIGKFIDKALADDLDVIVGSRILGSNYQGAPILRSKFLPFYTHIINRLTGYDMTDAMSGYRVFRVAALKKIIHVFDEMLEPQYLASEMFIRFSREGLTVGEVPINMQDRLKGHSYKGTIRYGWGVLKAIIRTMMAGNEN